ncbi:MAG: aminotransferase class V-fold PLP-dependent enzyme [Phenylobacterium sp.]|uniref:aminotransferase class V-fold PLP-dependent enzyme n=1 Tax=Phenylobacterium sp. TaxID=1871053 RepID=UPI002735AEAA|nr:aminotransferase class V-fold PLP-dependent enzyme [Phenylobacterium sp.]MDP3745767.1 aminotransferase class V-fold PLP-dependent enzyme [Phenylobacterium sp.]
MTGFTRRGLMGAGLALGPVAAAAADGDPWAKVAAQFDVTREVVQLENGNWGMMARPVLEAYGRHQEMVNRRTSYYSRRLYGPNLERVRDRVAASLGVDKAEIAFTRGATEALQALIGGYNRLRPGDAVLYADLDYDSMQSAMRWLKARRGVQPIAIGLPEPATHQGLIDAYAKALADNPRIRLILLTQVSHRTGLVAPVAEIVAMARARGVDAIVDSAHAWGQLDFKLPDLGADFVGLNAHKWIGAPVGVGVLYIRQGRAVDIDPYMGSADYPEGDVRDRIHSGTANFAAFLAVADALDFHEQVGVGAKAARLAQLRARWTDPLREAGGIEILTPPDPRLASAIGAVRLRGRSSPAENAQLARTLLDRFGIFTVARTGLASGACVRVTPAIFTRDTDIDRLVAALRTLGAS